MAKPKEEKTVYEYITVEETKKYSYYRIPKILFTDDFKSLSTDAKLLYGMMLERTGLSQKNMWLSEEGYVYIIYTIESIQEDLNCGSQKAVKLVDDLEEIGLIEREKQGFGQPNIIFVKAFRKSKLSSFENQNYRTLKTKTIGFRKSKSNNTEYFNKPNNNKDIGNTPKRFVKPSVEEVESFIKEKSLNIDARYFVDYYESNGWKVGKNSMKDWKATARNWDRRNREKGENNESSKKLPDWATKDII